MKYTQEQLEARFELLPESVREVITSPEVAEQVNTLREKYGLHVDEAGVLIEQVGYVLLGFTRPERFVAELKKALAVPESVVLKIAQEVNDIIFAPVRNEFLRPVAEAEDAYEEERADSERAALLREIETEEPKKAPVERPKEPALKPTDTPVLAQNTTLIPAPPSTPLVTPPTTPTNLPTFEPVDFAKEKLSKSVSLPREKEHRSIDTDTAHTTIEQAPVVEKKPYGAQDPYREPITETDIRS